jgi:hypothetical protein
LKEIVAHGGTGRACLRPQHAGINGVFGLTVAPNQPQSGEKLQMGGVYERFRRNPDVV